MKTYKIVGTIMLSFLQDNDQKDYLFEEGLLRTDGSTIWICTYRSHGYKYLVESDWKESITMANAIDLWEEQGKIRITLEGMGS